ncbi:TlpA family protein disulfide reductase [Demequina muriae]|uniref:Thioredoxin family protein n=1 Tax=Demequina muriae TaxID=3051664 RepID=A0ABT8GHD5_9MICO|nr:thioredoxin family protein [Demequina sp. EGI L300058]MDN4480681.1 thioredoxin family protein [Demequina sp. EGI L300058]
MLERILIIAALLAIASAGYWWWQRRQGRVREVHRDGALSSEMLGAKRGYRATFVQFSTPMCAKCPGTARLLTDVAEGHRQVVHLEIDASERLDLARELSIMRTPTTLVLDGDGMVVARMDGPPTREQAEAALATVPPSRPDYSI